MKGFGVLIEMILCGIAALVYLFHIEQGRRENIDDLRYFARINGEDPKKVKIGFPILTKILAFLVFMVVGGVLCSLPSIKLGFFSILVGYGVYALALIFILAFSTTPYQARGVTAFAFAGNVIGTKGLGASGRTKFGFILIFLILWAVSELAGRITAKMMEEGKIVRNGESAEEVVREAREEIRRASPQTLICIGVATVAIIAIIFIVF